MRLNCAAASVYIGYEDTDDGDNRVACSLPPEHPGFHFDDWFDIWWAPKDHPLADRYVWKPEDE